MVLAALAFTIMVACIHELRETLDTPTIVFWRCILPIPALVIFMLNQKHSFHLPDLRIFIVRCLFGFGNMVGLFYAAQGLRVTDMTAIAYVPPALVVIGATTLLREKPSRRIQFGTIVGFVGCIGAIGIPTINSRYGLAALGAACSLAVAHLALRRLGATGHTLAVVLWFHVACGYLALGLMQSVAQLVVPMHLWPLLVLASTAAVGGQVLVAYAYRHETASRVAPMALSGLLWGLLVDFGAFGVFPGPSAVCGGLIVLLALLAMR